MTWVVLDVEGMHGLRAAENAGQMTLDRAEVRDELGSYLQLAELNRKDAKLIVVHEQHLKMLQLPDAWRQHAQFVPEEAQIVQPRKPIEESLRQLSQVVLGHGKPS
eukprot:3939268-Rhodomonas_salina.2